MKFIISVLILILGFQSVTNADDISNFEIDGISVGDSLLDHLSKKQIDQNIIDYYLNDEFKAVEIDSKIKNYDVIQIHYKKNTNYIVHSIDGIFLIENINECINKINQIKNEFKKTFVNADKGDWKREPMYSNMGYLHGTYYQLKSGDYAELSCYEYKSNEYSNNGRVSLYTKEIDKWLETVKYK